MKKFVSKEAARRYYLKRYTEKKMKRIYKRVKDYDVEYEDVDYDIKEWIRMCQRTKPSRVLELGVGTGRVGLRLAKMRVKVTGIDISDSMKSRAKEKSEQYGVAISLEVKNMIDFDLKGKKFDLILITLNTFFHLYPEQRKDCFRSVLQHLEPNGIFGINVFNIHEKMRKGKFGEVGQYFHPIRTVFKKQGNIIYERWDHDTYNNKTKILSCDRETRKSYISKGVRTLTRRPSYVKRFNLYVLTPDQMKKTLEEYFIIDYELTKIDPKDEDHFWICRPRMGKC